MTHTSAERPQETGSRLDPHQNGALNKVVAPELPISRQLCKLKLF